jgi:hypothetical protein
VPWKVTVSEGEGSQQVVGQVARYTWPVRLAARFSVRLRVKGGAAAQGGASLSLSPESFLSLSPEESFVEPGGFAGVSSTAGIDSQQLPLKMT